MGEDPGEFPLGLSFFPKLLETQPPLTGPFSGRAVVCRRGHGTDPGFHPALEEHTGDKPAHGLSGVSDLHRALGTLAPRPQALL